jgi:phage/plasmid-associated DNA primase
MAVGYIDYIKARKVVDNQPITHTRIGDKSLNIYGGKYFIPENELPTFYKLYHEHVIINNNPEYLTEKQLDNSPILIDIDMRYSPDIKSKQHTKDHIIDMIYLYMNKILKICNIQNGYEFPIYIMEKDNVNVLEDKTKDGIHIIIGACCHYAIKQLIRNSVMYELKELWNDLPLTNDVNDLIDEGVCKGICNWQMFGSCKPDNEAYKLKYYYNFKFNKSNDDWDITEYNIDTFKLNNVDNFKLLSAQYTNYKTIEPNDKFKEMYEKIKDNYAKKKEKPKKLIIQTETKTDNNILQYCELINNEYLSNREDWLKIVFAMKREKVNEEDALRISNKATDCVDLTNDAWSNVWDREDDRENGCNIGTIKYYAKLSNEYEYHKLELKNMENYDLLQKTLDAITEYKLADLFYNICPNNIIYIKEEDKFYTWFNNKWNQEVKKIGSFSRLLIKSQLTKILNDYMIKICSIRKHQPEELETETKDKNNKLLQKIGDTLVLIEKTTWLNNIWTELQSFIISSSKDIKFDNNPNVIAFNNKKYDFIKKEFSKIQHDDYITMYSNYDWVEPKEDEMKIIDKLFEEIFPNEERRECYLSVLYSCCIGGVKDKFIIANGSGGNGKGVLNELTYDMLGDYSYEGNTNVLTEKIKNGANPELANMDKKRMIIYKEFNTEDKLRLDVLKKLVDNEVINARGLYSSKTETKLEATNIMEVNSRIKFSGKISGDSEARRLVDVLFESTFTDDPDILNDTTRSHVYEKDKRFKAKEFKLAHRCALFKYIVDKAKKDIYVPDIVKARTNEYIDKNDDLLNWFNDNYELTTEVTDIVKIKEVFDLYKESDEYQALYKKERPNLSSFTEDIKSNKHLRSKYKERLKIQDTNTTIRNVLQGVRCIDKDNDDDEEE